ncbi:MAG: S9 family peptidase [Ktedonobacteraceae bacterium]
MDAMENEETTTQRPALPISSEDISTQQQADLTKDRQTIAGDSREPGSGGLPYMDINDLLALKIVGDPQFSPDGKLIAFSVQHCNAGEDTIGSAIWLVSSAGGKTSVPRPLTSGAYNDTSPRWSPDGSMLAFISDRTRTGQIFLLPTNAGEARQLSFLQQGVTEYSWRPDGQAILALSYWKPDDDQSTPTTEEMVSVYTRLDTQWDGQGYKHARHKQLWLLPLTGDAQRITSEPLDLEQACWSPDGQQLVFCANRRQDPDLSVSRALWVLTLATGQMRRLTPEDGLAQMPAWSPDGRSIAYLYSPDQSEAGNISPWLVDAQGKTNPHPAVQGADTLTCQAWIIDELRSEWLAQPVWYPDSEALLVPAQDRGQLHLCRLDLLANNIRRLTSGNGRYSSPQISKDGQMIAMVRADWFTPGDIWCMDGAGQQPRKLTRVNDGILQGRQLIRPRRINWQSFDGLEMEGWLYLPPLPQESKAPLILAPHGGPSLAWGDAYVHEFQVLAGRGYAVFAPNPRGSAGYGEKFSRHILGDWGGADFHDLMVGLDYVIATEPVDEQRLGVGGMSYGGYMTNWIISQNDRFKAAVSRNGISSLSSATLLADQTIWFTLNMDDEKRQLERSPLTHVDAITTPLLLLHAENDLRCPFSESLQLFVALRKRKRPVELVRYHNTSHLMDWPTIGTPQQRTDRLRRTLQWFERFLS